MKRIDTCLMMMTGSLLIFTTGCITGTHTFSAAGLPRTQYCSIEDRAAPAFDIPSDADLEGLLSADQAVSKDGRTISLMP